MRRHRVALIVAFFTVGAILGACQFHQPAAKEARWTGTTSTTASVRTPSSTTAAPAPVDVTTTTALPITTTTVPPPSPPAPAPIGCAPSYQAVQEARAEAGGVPCAWVPTAICEEQGYDDGAYGFFGIQSWNGYGGYSSAGSAPLLVQLGWESAHGQGPPDAPGQCHGY